MKAAKINASAVTHATDTAKHWAEVTVTHALRFLADPEKRARLADAECRTCRYVRPDRIGGAALTFRPCGLCGEMMTFGNTDTDVLCVPCAVQHQLCRHCGADLHLRERRKFVAADGNGKDNR